MCHEWEYALIRESILGAGDFAPVDGESRSPRTAADDDRSAADVPN